MNREIFNRLHLWLDGKHPVFIVVSCFLMIGFIGIIDHVTGAELSFSIFYLFPVAIVSWCYNRFVSTVTAVTCAAVWVGVDYKSGHLYSHPLVPVWNAGVRLAFFLITGNLVTTVKDYLNKEKTLARIDSLTGVLNGRAFFEESQRFLMLSKRTGRPISLAYLDLDNFKTINDTKGHAEGDRLLREIARTLRKSIRNCDIAARLGGDEFALFLPDTGAEDSQKATGRIKQNISTLAKTQGWPISVSAGIVTFESAPNDLQQVVKLADELMYAVKRSGKDNVIHRVWSNQTLKTKQAPSNSLMTSDDVPDTGPAI